MRAMFGRTFISLCAAAALLLAGVGSAQAQRGLSQEELERQPGFVDFGDIWEWSDGDEEVEIHLTQPLLGVAGSFMRGEDPELADLILDLDLVRVNQFTFNRRDEDAVRDFIDDTGRRLRRDGWDNIVKVRERDERVNVFVKLDGDGRDPAETFLSGLCILVVDGDESAFVNVVGRFRLEDVARVGNQFDIPYAEEWERYDRRGGSSEPDSADQGGRR
ncbi:MAG TPA: DUF4252 domain-containing protein [Candidatus Krumholzibacteria bacterium]|nr:DUF4252 domain-containing protein [Candidatus Krumholzibacteria bacterium]